MNADTKAPTLAGTASFLADENAARTRLRVTRDALRDSAQSVSDCTDVVVNHVMRARPSGLLTVNEIAEALGRPRSYVDTLWSSFGTTTKGKQTRVTVDNPDPEAARHMYETLVDAAAALKRAVAGVVDARAERNRTVAMVYASKLLGPSAIAGEAGIDRNHVLRLARRAGVLPVHREGAKNQYTNA